MKVRDLIDILLDSCEMDDVIFMVEGKERDHDKFKSDWSEDIEWSTDRKSLYLFADFKFEREEE
jgi:hypothetical protein